LFELKEVVTSNTSVRGAVSTSVTSQLCSVIIPMKTNNKVIFSLVKGYLFILKNGIH
jgi:hypothetical protein